MDPLVTVLLSYLSSDYKANLTQAIYNSFRKSILSGDIPAGTKINESDVSSQLNMSRTPLRKALKQLLKDDLVEHLPGKGMVVKGITQTDAIEIYDIRKTLDILAFTKAMHLMSDKDFIELEYILNCKLEPSNKTDYFSPFNSYIYHKSQLHRLSAIINDLQSYLFYLRQITTQSSKHLEKANVDHLNILIAMYDHDESLLKQLIHSHLDYSLKLILDNLNQKLNEGNK